MKWFKVLKFVWITRHLIRDVMPLLSSKNDLFVLMKQYHEQEYEAAVHAIYGDNRGELP